MVLHFENSLVSVVTGRIISITKGSESYCYFPLKQKHFFFFLILLRDTFYCFSGWTFRGIEHHFGGVEHDFIVELLGIVCEMWKLFASSS